MRWLDRFGLFERFAERRCLAVRELAIGLTDLPASFHGLRIGHFSDLHLGHYHDLEDLRRLVNRLRSLQPDMICFTGDLVDTDVACLEEAIPLLAALRPPLGKYAVLGNHDYRAGVDGVTRALVQSGFRLLRNSHVRVRRGADELVVAGLDDALYGRPDVAAALHWVPEGSCVVLLVHEPDVADQASAHPVSLQLSGHTHGGQVRLPLVGHLLTPQLGKKYPDGWQRVKNASLQVYTSRGVGTTLLPVRLWCPPEIALLTLQLASEERNGISAG
ncbi:metallophosphoesterase [Brevibacillus sp. SYP-B805]|uniref:metallophosphoesterase n=1 Tax=Brevibacillus sp. SYP-B805 TaxID=1578199 RepID=UPI0013EDBE8B|nr:metallophosphoesterase [Brevibacillus sp. SYP-B805]